MRESARESVRAWAGKRANVLAQLVEDLSDSVGTLPPLLRLENEESERFRLSEVVARFLESAAAERPLVVVLDDLHWADSAALGMLEFVARGLAQGRVLLLGACRDVETDSSSALGRTLGALARARCFERIDVGALGKEHVAGLVQHSQAVNAGGEPADALWEKTRGNPLFVVEFLRARGPEDSRQGRLRIPPGIRALIRRQLQSVSRDCSALLEAAAAMGAEFTHPLLCRVTSLPERAVLRLCDEAVRSRFLAGSPDGNVLRFSHPLIQEFIAGEVTGSRRSELHLRIATVLEESYGGDTERHTVELARHYALAQPLAPTEKVTRYSLLAGEQALGDRAYEEAALHFRRGLAAKGFRTHDAESAWMRFGLAKAMAPWALFLSGYGTVRSDGDTDAFVELTAAFESFLDAGDLGSASRVAAHPLVLVDRATGDLSTLAARGLEIVQPGSLEEARLLRLNAMVDSVRAADYPLFCRRFARALDIAEQHGDTALALRITSCWAEMAGWLGFWGDLEVYVSRAMDLCRRVDDPVALHTAQFKAYHLALGKRDLGEAARLAEVLLATSLRLRMDGHIKLAHLVGIEIHRILGDWPGMRAASDQALAVESDIPLYVSHLGERARLELELGNTESGLQFLDRYLAAVKSVGFGHDDETAGIVMELALIARLNGRRDLLALAQTAAAVLTPPGQEHVPGGHYWYYDVGVLAMPAVVAGDREMARKIRPLLKEPNGPQLCGLEPCGIRVLGLLDLVIGDAIRAVAELEQALVDYAPQRSGPEGAWVCTELAESLIARGAKEDLARAAELLAESMATAKKLGMVPLQQRIRRLKA